MKCKLPFVTGVDSALQHNPTTEAWTIDSISDCSFVESAPQKAMETSEIESNA
jgi:hypothetical protein